MTSLESAQGGINLADQQSTLAHERSYLDHLEDPSRQKIGRDILEAFLEHGKCVVFGPPGAGKTTLIQCLRVLAQERLNSDGGGFVQPVGYDHFLDQYLKARLHKDRSEMTGDDLDVFSKDITRLVLRMRDNVKRSQTDPRFISTFRWLVVADMVGIGSRNLGKTTLMDLAKEPDFVFVQVIPSPEVLSIALNTRVAFFALGSSPKAQEQFAKRLELEQQYRPTLTAGELRAELTEGAMGILQNNNIVTDIQDPKEMADIIANMGGPGWITALRREIPGEAEQWALEGKIQLPWRVDEQLIYIRHGEYYREEVLRLPADQTFVVVNRLQAGHPIPWNLGRLYEDKVVQYKPIKFRA